MQRPLYITALAAFLFDQITKVFVVVFLDLQNILMIEVLPPFLNFSMAWNYGVNFGLFSNESGVQKWALTGFAVLVSLAVVYWVRREPTTKIGLIGAGLLIGGALGNAFDRMIYGAVADFLNMSCCGIVNPFAFNFADVEIFAGAFALAIFGTPKNNA